jgi:hypothetical protein
MDIARLNDDKLIGEMTFDKSDSFYWLKQQALRGVVSAQVCVWTLSGRWHDIFSIILARYSMLEVTG